MHRDWRTNTPRSGHAKKAPFAKSLSGDCFTRRGRSCFSLLVADASSSKPLLQAPQAPQALVMTSFAESSKNQPRGNLRALGQTGLFVSPVGFGCHRLEE
eukprot:Skav204034  [mRNA]  locus=scaffold1162:99733:100032:+ [translate_table: standard]